MSESREPTEEEASYKPITENPLKIDLGECDSPYDICALLKARLGLPECCGENWDAIWDLVRYIETEFVNIEFYGVSVAQKKFPEDTRIMLDIFDEVHKEEPDIRYTVIT